MKQFISFLFAIAFCLQGQAQPFTLDKNIQPTELKLSEFKTTKAIEKGKIAGVEVLQKNDTLYFFVKAISILAPVYVTLTADNKADKINISLHKDLWTETERSGTTDATGNYITSFKTGGDLGIRIACKENIKYNLFVWVGNEANIKMPTPFKKYAKKN